VLSLNDYSLKDVVYTVCTQMEALAADKGLRMDVEVAPDLPVGRGDERRLSQVLLNLVGNAIKFTDQGAVTVKASARLATEDTEITEGASVSVSSVAKSVAFDGEWFVVSVADTGPGIAEADQEKIFDEFQQADGTATRQKGGTGLGLAIARRIVEMHGGRIWVESAPGQGSIFTFTVPVRVERQVGAA
jgi:signal transduction histidine kinase